MTDDSLLRDLRGAHATAPVPDIDTDDVMAAARARRRRGRAGVATALAAVVVAGGALLAPGVTEAPEPPPPPADAVPDGPADPEDLLGYWRVTDAPELGDDVWLRIDRGSLHLAGECGWQLGIWAANGAAILVSPRGSGCLDAAAGPWLESWWSYAPTDDGWTLTDADGATVGTLARTTETSGLHPALPPLDMDTGPDLTEPADLPRGLAPATPADVVGRWTPADGTTGPDGAYVLLTDDGRWSGHDGCSLGAGDGRWALDASGRLLSTERVPLDAGGTPCPATVAAASLVAGGARVGVDGDQLVVLGRDAQELGRLVPHEGDGVGVDLEAACAGPCESRPNGWSEEQAALLGPIVERLRAVAEPYPQLVGVGPAYETPDLVLYWDGPLPAEVQAVVEDAAAAGVAVQHRDSHWPGWPHQAPVRTVVEALHAAGIAVSVGGYSKEQPGVRVSGPQVSHDPVLQEAARLIAAHVVGPEIPLTFAPFDGSVVGLQDTRGLELTPPEG